MDLSSLILLLNLPNFGFGIALIAAIFSFRKRLEVKWLMTLAIALMVVSFCSLNVYLEHDLESKIFYSRLRFIGLALISPSWFFFLTTAYGKINFLRSKWFIALSLLPATVTILFALIPSFNLFLTNSYEPYSFMGAELVKFKASFWLLVHIFSSNIFAITSLGFILYTFKKAKGVKRTQLIILFIGGLTSLSIDSFNIFTNNSLRWAMLSSSTFFIAEAAIFLAIKKHGLLDLSPIAKDYIFHELPNPILILDEKNKLLSFNDAASMIFDLSNDSKNTIYNIPQNKNLTHIDKNGTMRYFEINTISLSQEKSVGGKILFFNDITSQKKIEESLSKDLEFKAKLLTLISHDFSSLIQTQSYLSENIHKNIHSDLKNEASLLAHMNFASQDFLTNILRWSQSQESEIKPKLTNLEINTLIREVLNNLKGLCTLKEVNVHFKPSASPILFVSDNIMLESVLRNLLTNAIRATSSKKNIYFDLKLAEDSLLITIKDEGIGMNEKQIKAIKNFETLNPEGFGVGLVITQKLVSLLKGSLEFQSEEHVGTEVKLRLPLLPLDTTL